MCLTHRSNASLPYVPTVALRNVTAEGNVFAIWQGKAFSSSQQYPERLWGQLSHLINGHHRSLPRGQSGRGVILIDNIHLQFLTKDTAGTLWQSKLGKTPAITGTHSPLHSFHISPFYFLYIYFNIILVCKYVSEEPLSFTFYYDYRVLCVAKPVCATFLPQSLSVIVLTVHQLTHSATLILIKILQDAQLSSKWEEYCQCSLWRYSALCHETLKREVNTFVGTVRGLRLVQLCR